MARKKATSCGTCTVRWEKDGPWVLLVRPSGKYDAWGFPKGHVDGDETHEDCAVRETMEETGVSVTLSDIRLAPVVARYGDTDKTVHVWLATQNDPTIEPYSADGENFEVRYWPVETLPPFHKYQEPLLKQLVDILIGQTS